MSKGLLIILSGPSGAGKGTVLKRVREKLPGLQVSVSATTRLPREGEENGVHYHFISRDDFERTIDQNGLLEYACYCDNYYGTLKAPVEQWREKGLDVVLEIEVQGAVKVLKQCPDAVSVFVTPPSLQELERRLINRRTETSEAVSKRLKQARAELSRIENYQYLVINDDIETAAGQIVSIIEAEKCRLSRNREFLGEMQV